MAKLSKQSLSFLEAFSNSIDRERSAKSTTQPDVATVTAYADAAAVVHVFDPHDLNPPPGTAPDPSARRQLIQLSYLPIGNRHKRHRALNPAERVRALKRVATPTRARELLAANPDREMTAVQSFFEGLLHDKPIKLTGLSHARLLSLREAHQWVRILETPRFDPLEIETEIANAASIAPFEHLLLEDFVGREDSIDEFREFVGIVSPDLFYLAKQLFGFIRVKQLFGFSPTPVMFLEGPGGIGKTALIGHFLFQHRADKEGPLFPFAYLACDDPLLDIREPQTLLLDAAAQFERQIAVLETTARDAAAFGDFRAALRKIRRISDDHADERRSSSDRKSVDTSQEVRLGRLRGRTGQLADAFAHLVNCASRAMKRDAQDPPPVLLLVDTFEEVQYQAHESMLGFWRLVDRIFSESAAFRLLISGRAPLPDPKIKTRYRRIVLKELDEDAAIALLRRESNLSTSVLRPVAKQIGGNPLSLRLAAQVIRKEAPKRSGIEGINTRQFLFFSVGQELIRGQLYRRLLHHIHDDDVRTLAHPGMVVRRVTPKVILEVLAPACEIKNVDQDRAQVLFERLQAEHTLVRVDDDGSLRYREDVRSAVIELLEADQPKQVRRTHEYAASFYERESGSVAIAESIYHRLMMGADMAIYDDRWTRDAEPYLRSAVMELPPEGKVWLAGRMSIELPDKLYREADTALWEKITGPKALSLLQYGSASEALEMLHERRGRTTTSALFAIEARCLLSLGLPSKATKLLEGALRDYPITGNPGRRAEILWLLQMAQRTAGTNQAANATLDQLIEIARSLNSQIALVQAIATRLHPPVDAFAEAADLQGELLAALTSVSPEEIHAESDVVRTGLSRLPADSIAAAGPTLRGIASSLVEAADRGRIDAAAVEDAYQQLFHDPSDGYELRRVRAVRADLSRAKESTEVLLDILEQAIKQVERSNQDGARHDIAARIVWCFLQAETGDLSAATLGGIDEYRSDWELSASAEFFA